MLSVTLAFTLFANFLGFPTHASQTMLYPYVECSSGQRRLIALFSLKIIQQCQISLFLTCHSTPLLAFHIKDTTNTSHKTFGCRAVMKMEISLCFKEKQDIHTQGGKILRNICKRPLLRKKQEQVRFLEVWFSNLTEGDPNQEMHFTS